MARKQWTDDEVLKFWQDSDTRDLIVNALPPVYSAHHLHDPLLAAPSLPGPRSGLTISPSSKNEDTSQESEDKVEEMAPALVPSTTPQSGSTSYLAQAKEFFLNFLVRPIRNALGFPHNVPTNTEQSAVGLEDLKKFPQQSVGKLFWFKPGKREPMSFVTAFYVGNGKIITVAHTFDKKECNVETGLFNSEEEESLTAVFVPAMINKEDIYGGNYGHYKIVGEPRKHPYYTPTKSENGQRVLTTSQYDICCVHIGKGGKQVGAGQFEEIFIKDKSTEAQQDDNPEFEQVHVSPNLETTAAGEAQEARRIAYLQPIQLIECHQDRNTSWIALGYGEKGLINNAGKMLKVQGRYVSTEPMQIHHGQPMNDEIVRIKPPVLPGMSGGPWLLRDEKKPQYCAIGCQSGFDESFSYSPYFNKELIGLVINEPNYISEN